MSLGIRKSYKIDTEHFVDFLSKTFLELLKGNSAYSLRSFAKSIDMDPSLVSKVINRKRNPSMGFIEKFFSKVDFEEFALFSEEKNQLEMDDGETYENFEDWCHIIANWYYPAICELTRLKEYRCEPLWIAERLGITKVQVEIALLRLEKVKMILKDQNGIYKRNPNNLTNISNNKRTNEFLRNLQIQFLEKSRTALENIPRHKRDHTNITMAIDTRLIPRAKERIKNFRRELSDELQVSGEYNEVYQLSIGLFPITEIKNDH
jgi:uncharacterized protein (TIGR02147 family)